MALTTQQRIDVRKALAARYSSRREAFNLTKADFDAAVAAVDDWIDANAASYNSALPVAARTALTAAQKAELLFYLAMIRYGG